VLVSMQSNTSTALSLTEAIGPFDQGSTNGERGAKPARVKKVVGYPPLSERGDFQRRGFREALLEADR
jgi:hypothetical protein